jgi:hypothetical protein
VASARIPYNQTTALGQKIRAVVAAGVEMRKNAEELDRVLVKYNDDAAGIATDSGIDSGNVATVRNLVASVVAESTGVTLGQINAGTQTSTRQFLDAMS